MAEIGVFKFLFGTTWDASTNQFGILPLILASICGTVGAIIIGVPIGILTAVFLTEIARPRVAKIIHPAIELLAGIPSVVYGFFGMLVIVPAIRAMFPGQTIGDSLLAAIIILAIMVIPTIVNVTENALRAVPKSYREASLGLGATPIRTIFKVTIPAARSGILSGVILGVGRAIGETMAVLWSQVTLPIADLIGYHKIFNNRYCNGNVLCVRSASSGIICNRFGAIYLYYDCKYLLHNYFKERSESECQVMLRLYLQIQHRIRNLINRNRYIRKKDILLISY